MRKPSYILPLIILFGTLCGCEVEIDAPTRMEDNSITVTALAVASEPLTVRLSWTEGINDALSAPFADSYEMWRVLNFLKETHPEDSLIYQEYYKKHVATTARVKANIDGNEYDMTYNDKTLNYEYPDYTVKPGDRISINVQVDTLLPYQSTLGTQGVLESTSRIEVPSNTPGVEILKAEKIYRELEKYDPLMTVERGVDSVVVFTLKLRSQSPGVNFYRLKVTSMICVFDNPGSRNSTIPISAYHTSDPLLYDAAIDKGFGPWPAYQSDVFTDESFHSGEYIISLSSRVAVRGMTNSDGPLNTARYFEIELQPINAALMNYLSVLYRLRIATPSYFSEPSTLPSNIDGGVGIFGAIGKSAKIRYWLPGEENPAIPPL